MKATCRLGFVGLSIGLLGSAAVADGPTVVTTVENQVKVVRHGVKAAAPKSTAVKKEETRNEVSQDQQAQLRLLGELADLGLIHIVPIRTQTKPLWTYTPPVYYGYRPKPNMTYHRRPGWQFDDASGWRYRETPRWADRPVAVSELLAQLPRRGADWYVARWR